MAVLELFREATILLDQPECFGELTVRWTPPGGCDRSGHDASTPHSVRGGRPAPDQAVRGGRPASDQAEENAAGDDDRRA